MSRRKHPTEYLKQRDLFKKMKAKHVLDGAGSVLNPKLLEAGIDLTADELAGTNADSRNNNALAFAKEAEKHTENRDKILDPIFSTLRRAVQNLKTIYTPAVHKLGDWTITVNGNEIVYPEDFLARKNLVLSFYAKHNSFPPGTSPLQTFITENAVNVVATLAAVPTAVTAHDNAKQKAIDSEDEFEQRDILWLPVNDDVEEIGDYLVNLYPNNSKKVGDWSYVIDDSPREPHLRTVTLKPLTQKTVRGAVLGKPLTSQSPHDIEVFSGDTATGTPQIIAPNTLLGINKGMSVITLRNPNSLVAARLTVLVH